MNFVNVDYVSFSLRIYKNAVKMLAIVRYLFIHIYIYMYISIYI